MTDVVIVGLIGQTSKSKWATLPNGETIFYDNYYSR